MLIDTHKTYKRLVEEYGFTEQHAEGIIETISSAEEQVATKEDIEPLGQASKADLRHEAEVLRQEMEVLRQEMKAEIRSATIKTISYTTGAVAILLALFEFAL